MTLPRQDIGWTPDTLYVYTERRFTEMDRRFGEAMQAQKESLEQFQEEVAKRFDGTDKNFQGLRDMISTLGTTISERGGALALVKQVIPSVIALGSVIAVIVVGTGH